MDILTHAVVGAVIGNGSISCIVAACLPDLVLGIKRRKEPPPIYKFTHSIFPVAVLLLCGFQLEAAAWASHIILDIPTHGPVWSPNLLYPVHKKGFSCFGEWEFFNGSWFLGLFLSVFLCLMLQFVIGFR